jgi:hypothetical protein
MDNATYAAARKVIDAKARAIVEREYRVCGGWMAADKLAAHAWTQAELYRSRAINELAFEQLSR